MRGIEMTCVQGTSDKASICETCGCKLVDCIGHFGFIQLELPVFHIGYFKHIMFLLNVICKVTLFTLHLHINTICIELL